MCTDSEEKEHHLPIKKIREAAGAGVEDVENHSLEAVSTSDS